MNLECTCPLFRIDARESGFLRLPSDFQNRRKNDGVFLRKGEREYLLNVHHFPSEYIQKLRCGQCTACRLHRSKEWAVRCMHELPYHKNSIFVTLTYNDQHLPLGEWLTPSGEIVNTSLVKGDMQRFLKRFRVFMDRQGFDDGFCALYCGEYGELNDRPHYHAILFGVPELKDRFLWRKNDGISSYRSPTLEKLWSTYDRHLDLHIPIGHVEFSDVTFQSAAYVSRYCMKKITGKPITTFMDYYSTLVDPPPIRLAPFMHCSTRPAIGARYALDHFDDIYDTDSVLYQKDFKVFCAKPPRYYDKLYDVYAPDLMTGIKASRKEAGLAGSTSSMLLFDGSEDSFLKTRALLHEELKTKLKRGL